MVGDGSESLIDRLFREEQVRVTSADPTFVESLAIQEASEDMTDQCLICLQEFKAGDRYVTLPCHADHKFHCEHATATEITDEVPEPQEVSDTCPGILPWFQANHRCPICRHEFPKGVSIVHRPENLSTGDQGPGPIPPPLLDFASLLELMYPNQGHPLQEHANPEEVQREQEEPLPPLSPLSLLRALVPRLVIRPAMSEEEQMQRAIEESLGMS